MQFIRLTSRWGPKHLDQVLLKKKKKGDTNTGTKKLDIESLEYPKSFWTENNVSIFEMVIEFSGSGWACSRLCLK